MTRNRITTAAPIIGVTGAIGSGKSAVTELFSEWGAVTISADEIGHRVLANSRVVRHQLTSAFGDAILVSGTIDRALLARRALSSSARVLTLNRIVHPALIQGINRAISRAAKDSSTRAVVIDAALLVEWGMNRIHWDYLVGVSAPYHVRIRRLRARGVTLSQIRQFSKAQIPWKKKCLYCDFIVKNDASKAILRRRARLCWDKMLSFE